MGSDPSTQGWSFLGPKDLQGRDWSTCLDTLFHWLRGQRVQKFPPSRSEWLFTANALSLLSAQGCPSSPVMSPLSMQALGDTQSPHRQEQQEMQSPSSDTQRLLNQISFTYVYNQLGFFHAHFLLLQKCYLPSIQEKYFLLEWHNLVLEWLELEWHNSDTLHLGLLQLAKQMIFHLTPDCESLCNKWCQNVIICSDLLLSAQVKHFWVPVCRFWTGRGGWDDFAFKERPWRTSPSRRSTDNLLCHWLSGCLKVSDPGFR